MPAVATVAVMTGGATGKVVAKLLTEGLVEEIQSRGSLPVWRRDGDNAHTVLITKRGLRAIRDELPKKPPARSAFAVLIEVESTPDGRSHMRRIDISLVELLGAPRAEQVDRSEILTEGVVVLVRAHVPELEIADQHGSLGCSAPRGIEIRTGLCRHSNQCLFARANSAGERCYGAAARVSIVADLDRRSPHANA
jgi:hypothetical protein